jgi:hypothetical protein
VEKTIGFAGFWQQISTGVDTAIRNRQIARYAVESRNKALMGEPRCQIGRKAYAKPKKIRLKSP